MSNFSTNGLLSRMISSQEPLGPIATPETLQKSNNRHTFDRVFDAENFLCNASKTTHPNIILGRRGAGKTAYLYFLKFDGGFSFATSIDSAQVFREVSMEISQRVSERASGSEIIVETTAKLWRTLLLTTMLKSFWTQLHNRPPLHSSNEMNTIEAFLETSGLKQKRSVRRILSHMIGMFENLSDKNLEFVEEFLSEYWWEEAGFGDAWNAAINLMHKHGIRGALLIDSLEQFPMHEKPMADALGGLLHFIGQLELEYLPVDITLCFQAELYREFSGLSRNPEKDLQRVLTMHWEPMELLQICGHRFSLFLNSNAQLFPIPVETLPDRPSRDEVLEFWRQFLPEKITNRYGNEESSLAYILRHTQLLPRHMISLLNQMVRLALAARDVRLPFVGEDVLRGVRLGEENICLGVLSGFEMKYPQARSVIEKVLPNIANLSTYAELQRTNNRYGKGQMATDGMVEMLIRMGILGTLEKQTEYYDICRFDYTFNGTMPYSTNEQFGLHPAFAGQFGAAIDTSKGRGFKKPIYPKETFDERLGVGLMKL